MKRVLIDINIVLDMLRKRKDHYSAASIFDLCSKRRVKGFLCAHEVTTISFFLEKFSYPRSKAVQVISNLLDVFTVIPVTETILREAFQSPIKDFEDAVIEVSAVKEEIDCIITRNIKDFKTARLACYTGSEYLAMLSTD